MKVTDDRLAVARAVKEAIVSEVFCVTQGAPLGGEVFGVVDDVNVDAIIESLPEPPPLPAPTGPDPDEVRRVLQKNTWCGCPGDEVVIAAARAWLALQLPAELSGNPGGLPCAWTEDADGNWHTGCGKAFFFDTDGPTANGFAFCPYCSKPLQPPAEVQPHSGGGE